ncbi:hypothetical protein [Hydrogenophaga laconesensis]|uniref:Uncharacterized protein n=1 Tax=Hydrogenophaga laconesensis TaxID=1805971 RepID=A0ABU1V4R5_9BURK|nr:hypothetical protein [Hydrogenophaga laconesensis]MDR7092395.1 hypothetical protein [Hydrogenophaga laconesensis]
MVFIQFNFTDGKALASIVCMRDNTTQTSPTRLPHRAATPHKKDRNTWRRAVDSVRDSWSRAAAALARAEQHIMENFRQPPHGG